MSASFGTVFTTPDIVVDLRLSDAELPQHLRPLVPEPGVLRMLEENATVAEESAREWIGRGSARIGGVGNTAGPDARLGMKSLAVFALGAGSGARSLDPQGEYCLDMLDHHHVLPIYQRTAEAPTSTTFIVGGRGEGERQGILYAPNANKTIDLDWMADVIAREQPDAFHWMYHGLSGARVDRELPKFLQHLQERKDCIISVDTHTLLPDNIAGTGKESRVNPHALLPESLPHLNLFFCSLDEARLIWAALKQDPARLPRAKDPESEAHFIKEFLNTLYGKYADVNSYRQVFGVTQKEQVWYRERDGEVRAVRNLYLASTDGGKNLVGAGDGFRAGMIARLAAEPVQFFDGKVDMAEAILVGNLVAGLAVCGADDEKVRYDGLPKKWPREADPHGALGKGFQQ